MENNLENKNSQIVENDLEKNENNNEDLLLDNNSKGSFVNSSLNEEKVIFSSLSPTKLEKINPIYKKALDFAFSNDDIKNIAITGIYGAGKSTVWNSYVDQSGKRNIITVSLGAYNNIFNDGSNEKNETLEVNRIERQLINQILAQINSNSIPLSKFAFKTNDNMKFICKVVSLFVVFVIGIILLLTRDTIFSLIETSKLRYKIFYLISCSCFLIIPLSSLVFWLLKNDKLKILKINFKGTEANFEFDTKEETVLDRDIKEIVYLLDNSGTCALVFEDLDRYENIEIFTKLRELNYLLNSFIKTNGGNKIVKFVYMIKDGVFCSKERTKFFDFIIPIVPVVDSSTSNNELMTLLKNTLFIPDNKVVTDISLYVDDMRLLKNIVNEYIVYSNIIPLNELKLNINKMFSLVVLKNVFPKEFDSLQNDEGFIFNAFKKINDYRTKIRRDLNKEISEIENQITYIEEQKENDLFDTMALMIPANVKTQSTSLNWSEFLKIWATKPKEEKIIHYSNNSAYFTYDEFVEKIIFVMDNAKHKIDKINEANETNLNIEYKKVENKKREISKINSYSYKQIIENLSQEEIDDIFVNNDKENIQDHYFPLIRYLIVNGLLDESYYFYKGIFDVDKNVLLKQNDMIYYKSLLEGETIDCFFDVSTPSEIVNQLDEIHFNKPGIINKTIIEYCLNNNKERFDKIFNTVVKLDRFDDLLRIMDSFDISLIKIIVERIVNNDIDSLNNLVFLSSKDHYDSFSKLLASLITCNAISLDVLAPLHSYFEENESFCELIEDKDLDVFKNNLNLSGIKLELINKMNVNKNLLYCIEEINSYELSVSNVLYLVKTIIGNEVKYGELLKIIYEDKTLTHTKEYIEGNFDIFVAKYINQRPKNERFDNGDELLKKILLSTISIDERVDYAKNNETLIDDLSSFNPIVNDDIISTLFEQDTIIFNKRNIKFYCDNCINYCDEFLRYLERHINSHNSKEIFENNSLICDSLVLNKDIDDNLFANMLPFCNEKVETINPSINLKRLHLLIENNLILKSKKNIELLYDNNMFNEIIHILILSVDKEQKEIADWLISFNTDSNLVYKLINCSICFDASKVLLDYLNDEILLDKIKSDKTEIIRYVLLNYLTKVNVDYVCNNFYTFKFKYDFIKVLDDNDDYGLLDNKNLNKDVMAFILTSDVSISMKVVTIITKIKNNSSALEIKNYIAEVDEISEISAVWKGRFPSIDNVYKEEICEALIENDYVKERKGKERRIMVVKK